MAKQTRYVKIFLSSTFKGKIKQFELLSYIDAIIKNQINKLKLVCFFSQDTQDERNYLLEHVYLKLKEYCKNKYGLDFQVKF